MKFKINIANKDVLLTDKQLAAVIDILHGADLLNNEYVGSSKGDNGTAYAKCIRTLDTSEMNLSPLADDYVETLRLRTKLLDDSK